MTVQRRRIAVPAFGDWLRAVLRSTLWMGRALVLALILTIATSAAMIAQLRPDVRDSVIPAAVQIWILAEVTSDGAVEPLPLPMGSGTVVSASGHILTNRHVVNMEEHRRMLDGWETQAASDGQRITIELFQESVLVFTSDGENPPEPRYIATIATTDEALDLAVLQVVGDRTGLVDPAFLNLPFVPLGDSDAVRLGDPVDLFGYPGIADGTLTYTAGVVSGFITDRLTGRVWINSDATMSGGSSGGTAINREGELIGIPTQGSLIDCRPADMNQDGRIDSRDVGCLVSAGSIGQLRPVNLALDLLYSVGWNGSGDGNGRQLPPIIDRLPNVLPLDHAACFGIVDDGTEDFAQVLGRFSGIPDAADRLQTWGWQASAFRQFGCDGPPEGEAGWIDISVHRFADAVSAQEAVDYFTAVRADGTFLIPGTSPSIGDHSTALSGPASNGKEFTVYASQGPLLVRVTGVSPSGIPFMNVLSVTQAVLAAQQTPSQLAPTSSEQVVSFPASAYLPTAPAVRHDECFEVLTEGTYAYGDVVASLRPTGLPQSQLDNLGWQDGAYIVFTCDESPAGRAAQIDVGIHQFQDAASAQQALPYFSTMFELERTQHRDCDVARNLVVCVSARSLTGSPLSDVAFVLQQVVGAAR